MTKHFNINIGERDLEILESLASCPLTPKQLCKLSTTFTSRFNDLHNVRRRLRLLLKAGLISKFPYSVQSDGRAPDYWKLTRDGFRLLYDDERVLPKRNFFEAIRPAHHYHTHSLAETIVHLSVSAKENNCDIIQVARENSVKLVAEPFTLYPDCAFVIRRSDGKLFSFVIELDNSSERVRSAKDVECIERKLRGYDTHQATFESIDPNRYVVMFVTTRSMARLEHILELAADITTMPDRKIFVGCHLDNLLASNPFSDANLLDHRGLQRTLIPAISDLRRRITKPSWQKVPYSALA